jgi:hypothetical protein
VGVVSGVIKGFADTVGETGEAASGGLTVGTLDDGCVLLDRWVSELPDRESNTTAINRTPPTPAASAAFDRPSKLTRFTSRSVSPVT